MIKNIQKKLRGNTLTYILLLVFFAVMYTTDVTGVLSHQMSGLLVNISYNIILAVSLNLVVGISGELSLGHAGFMCAGAYAGSVFSLFANDSIGSDLVRFIIAMIIGGLFSALLGFLIGIPVLRLRGDYLAIVTLAFGEIIKTVLGNLYIATDKNGLHISLVKALTLDPETKNVIIDGAAGMSGIPRDSSFIIAFVFVMICVAVVLNMIGSRTGRAVMAIRDNRIAAESIGLNVTKYKLIAFTVSTMFAGIAGVLYAHKFGVLYSQNLNYNLSIEILVFVVLGGMGSIRGSIISAVILTVLPELLRGLGDFRMLIYAVLLIAMMIANNNPTVAGYVEKLRLWIGSLFRKNGTSAGKSKEEA